MGADCMKFRYEVIEKKEITIRYEKELEAEDYEEALKLIQTYGAVIGHTISEVTVRDAVVGFRQENIRRAYSSPRLKFLDERECMPPKKEITSNWQLLSKP